MKKVLFIIPLLGFLLSCSKGNLDSFDFSGPEFELESLATPKSFDFVVDERTYRMNSSISQEMVSIGSLEANKVYSTEKASNNCFYEYKIDTIENKMGVYTNYSNGFYSASLLMRILLNFMILKMKKLRPVRVFQLDHLLILIPFLLRI